MKNPASVPLQVITGKGGVGKSAVAAALALALADGGRRRVLLATMNGVDDTARLLGCQPLGMHEREVLPGVWAVAMTGESTRLEYATKVLRFERMARLIFANRLVRSLLDFVPGLNAVNQLGKLQWHVNEPGDRHFDHVVLEAPASGHAISTLRSASIIHQMAPPGPMRRDTGKIVEMLGDPGRTAVHVVTLATALSCSEAVDLAAALRQRAAVPLGLLICNRTVPVPPAGDPPPGAPNWAQFIAREVASGRSQRALLERTAKTVQLPMLELPEIAGGGRIVVEALAPILAAAG
jgi:anion-transporting  ArsA/GET3 family ATPase